MSCFSMCSQFIAQAGDPTGTGREGAAALGGGRFQAEKSPPRLNHMKRGTVGMIPFEDGAHATENGSRFYITLRDGLSSLDGKYTVFGTVAEDLDHVLEKFNGVICDQQGRPTLDIRIKHTYILHNPFEHMKIDAPDSPAPDICRPDEETVEPRRQYVTETTTPVGAVTLDSSHQNEGTVRMIVSGLQKVLQRHSRFSVICQIWMRSLQRMFSLCAS